jgi:hypothetical protein
MRIINVLKTNRGIIEESYSFLINDETKSFDAISAANDKFMELVLEDDPELTEEDLYEHLESAYYLNYDGLSIDIYFSDQVIEQ